MLIWCCGVLDSIFLACLLFSGVLLVLLILWIYHCFCLILLLFVFCDHLWTVFVCSHQELQQMHDPGKKKLLISFALLPHVLSYKYLKICWFKDEIVLYFNLARKNLPFDWRLLQISRNQINMMKINLSEIGDFKQISQSTRFKRTFFRGRMSRL